MTTWAHAGKIVTPLYYIYRCIWRILAPAAKAFTHLGSKKYSTNPYGAIESWNGSLAQIFYKQEAKQKWPTVTTLPHLTVFTTSPHDGQVKGLITWVLVD